MNRPQFSSPRRRLRTWLLAAVLLLPAASCRWVGDGDLDTAQGWSEADRAEWYWATQGSRLMPKSWFDALEVSGADDQFAAMDNLTRFGFLAPPPGFAPPADGLPIGFAVDRQADEGLRVTRLRWYEGQSGGATTAEPWVGLNCAACHTGQVIYDGVATTVDGAGNLLDFQSFIEDLDRALVATRQDPSKFDRFAGRVLAERDTPANRAALTKALDRLIAWQGQTEAMNATDLRYGYGRLDAVGHILNKVLMFSGAAADQGNPANAPVSYPFIWGIGHHERVQWNGIARNSRFELPGDAVEYGALGRNTGEVLGVFGEVLLEPQDGPSSFLRGYRSSVRTASLDSLERRLRDLRAPTWPEHLPPIDEAKREEGEALFDAMCSSCHLEPPTRDVDEPVERMLTFEETLASNPADLTDIWMACNAFVYRGPSGVLAGTDDIDGTPLGEEAQVAAMLAVAVRGTILGDKAELATVVFRNFLGLRAPPEVDAIPEQLEERAEERALCLGARDVPTLGYKARPLDGIWATAPYLHNGSVASLYELLLPPPQRAPSFWVGNRTFDPVKVGFVDAPPADGNGFLMRTLNEEGVPIAGNSPEGHDYGVGLLTDAQRFAIIEYLKSQ